MTKMLICVAGLPRSGKNTLAAQLREAFDMKELAIASNLYWEVSRTFGVSIPDLQSTAMKSEPQNCLASWNSDDPDYRQLLKRMGVDMLQPQTSRFHLRHWGTEYRRARDRFYWMNALHPELVKHSGGSIVINDMRRFDRDFTEFTFLREFAANNDMHFQLITVSRAGSEQWGHSSDDPFPDHMVDLAVENAEGRPGDMLWHVGRHLKQTLGV